MSDRTNITGEIAHAHVHGSCMGFLLEHLPRIPRAHTNTHDRSVYVWVFFFRLFTSCRSSMISWEQFCEMHGSFAFCRDILSLISCRLYISLWCEWINSVYMQNDTIEAGNVCVCACVPGKAQKSELNVKEKQWERFGLLASQFNQCEFTGILSSAGFSQERAACISFSVSWLFFPRHFVLVHFWRLLISLANRVRLVCAAMCIVCSLCLFPPDIRLISVFPARDLCALVFMFTLIRHEHRKNCFVLFELCALYIALVVGVGVVVVVVSWLLLLMRSIFSALL